MPKRSNKYIVRAFELQKGKRNNDRPCKVPLNQSQRKIGVGVGVGVMFRVGDEDGLNGHSFFKV